MIQSVQRAVEILRCFDGPEYLGVTEIARLTGLNKSTVFGLISTLAETGLLEQNPETGRYRLGLELFRLGSHVDADVRRLVMPVLEELAVRLQETVNFVRQEDNSVVYLLKHESNQSMRICTTIGQRLPMYCTAVGKVILALLPPDEQDRILASFNYQRFTRMTVSSAEQLRAQLPGIAAAGCAIDNEELEYGLICVAVPIRDGRGRPVGAISCSGPKERMTRVKLITCREALTAQAARLGALLR